MTQTDTDQNTQWLIDTQAHFTTCLTAALPPDTTRLHQAMRYAALNGGKRLRPLLVYATGLSFGTHLKTLDAAAVAVELIHCYSLVHDDLPAMDDDDLRRGKPSCHKAFDEATAILAGDALQSLAFAHLAAATTPQLTQQLKVLAEASGAAGMVGGQSLDIDSEGETLTRAALAQLHTLKTGALFQASVQLGALAAGITDTAILTPLNHFAQSLGLCFQIQDDILDAESSSQHLGKTAGKDKTQQKASYVTLLGLPEAKAALAQQHQHCHTELAGLTLGKNTLGYLLDRCIFRSQ